MTDAIKKIDEYKIVQGANLENLEDRVNRFVVLGWVPQGGVYFAAASYVQAMICPATDKLIKELSDG